MFKVNSLKNFGQKATEFGQKLRFNSSGAAKKSQSIESAAKFSTHNSKVGDTLACSRRQKWIGTRNAFILASISISGVIAYEYNKSRLSNLLIPTVKAIEKPSTLSIRERSNCIIDAVQIVAPSVVTIKVFKKNSLTKGISQASGVIVDSNGLVVTNGHVFHHNEKYDPYVVIKLQDGRKLIGRAERIDRGTDLAAIQILGCTNLPFVKLGNSDDLSPGEAVATLGSPKCLENSISTGVISGSLRTGSDIGFKGEKRVNFIQTDAPTLPGNSGGPLINVHGELIGINTGSMYGRLSFAICVDHVRDFLRETKKLREDSEVFKNELCYFQMSEQDESDPKSKVFKNMKLADLPDFSMKFKRLIPDTKDGVVVLGVVYGSPAYKAGISAFDIIQSINGKQVTNLSDIDTIASEKKNQLKVQCCQSYWK